MPVYVDDMRAKFRRMIMCHLMADTEEELLDMADKIGVARKWYQRPGIAKTSTPHFDICLSMKAKAITCGAIELKRPDDSDKLLDVIRASRAWYMEKYGPKEKT